MDEPISGGCRCQAVRFSIAEAIRTSLCHCRDCQRSAGAPLVEWTLIDELALTVTGEVADYASSPGAVRSFCPRCGTGLFYRNAEIFPDKVDVQTSTFDEPDRVVPEAQMQLAEKRSWFDRLDAIPSFERYPKQ